MKKLIFPLILLVSSVYAADPVKDKPEILSDKEINRKLIAVVKDVEVEGMLSKTNEFTQCKQDAKFKPSMSEKEKEDEIKKATKCLEGKLSKDPEQLKKLAENLNLQSYGLVRSKNMQDITNYLGNKMYKSLTGFDREEKDREKYLESLKFKNQTHVDQKIFIDLYMTQLSKSALYEVSRYCFEDFRNNSGPKNNWAAHWGSYKTKSDFQSIPLANLSDTGGSFTDTKSSASPDDAAAVFKQATDGIATASIEASQMEPFFNFCSGKINDLCSEYTKDTSKSIGAKSCLVMNRLQEIRKAINNTQKVQDQFAKMTPTELQIQIKDPVKFYQATNDNSLDDLTNVSSMDMIKGGYKKDDLTEKCIKQPESPECEAFLVVDDSKDKVVFNSQLQRSMEKEIEIARLKAIKANDDKSILQYLEDNAYFDIAERFKQKDPTLDIETEITNIFKAKIKAEKDALEASIGKRQKSDNEVKDKADKQKAVFVNAQDLQSERTRLAQVVLFNNIVTSHLSLYDAKTKDKVGQNVGAWKKEAKDQKNASFDQGLFDQVQSSVDKIDSNVKNNSIVGLELIESILGKK